MDTDLMDEHARHAEAVRAAAAGGSGTTDPSLRRAVMGRAAGGDRLQEPFDSLARQIGDAAYRVTDAQVAAVRASSGSDQGAFEVILAASIGAGLHRWDAAVRVIGEARDAAG